MKKFMKTSGDAISATLVSALTILAVLLVAAVVLAPLVQWIAELMWDILTLIAPPVEEWWKEAIGKDPDNPKRWGTLLRGLAWPLIKWPLVVLSVLGGLKFEPVPLKTFEVTQLEVLASRWFTVGNGTGLNVSLKVGNSTVPLLVYHPDNLPTTARRTQVVVKATDRHANPVFFDLLFVGKPMNPVAVYNFGGLEKLLSQVRELISGSLNAVMVDKDGYTLETDKDGRTSARLNKEVYAEGRQAVETILNGSGFFEVVEHEFVSGKKVKYYRYLIDGKAAYEFQEIQIADSRFSEAIAATLEKLQIEQIDASGEKAKAKIQEEIVKRLRLQGVPGDLAGILAAKAMGNQPDGVVWTTAETLVTGGGGNVLVGGKK